MSNPGEKAQSWKAGCGESRTPGSEGGVEKPAERQGAPPLPYLKGTGAARGRPPRSQA
jgi:hypothetical protein